MATPNVLTAITPTLFNAAARHVPRQLTGFLGALDRNFDDQGVAKGDSVKITVVVPGATSAIPDPSMAFSAPSQGTTTTIDFTLASDVEYKFALGAEEERKLLNSGGNLPAFFDQHMQLGWDKIGQTIDAFCGVALKNSASCAIGTAGTAPFASNFDLLADAITAQQVRGGHGGRQSAVLGTAAAAGLRKQSVLYKVNEAGSADLMRQGVLGRLHGYDIRESPLGTPAHTKGTGANYVLNGAHAAGATSIVVKTGTGTIVAGDVITIAGDSTGYVVTSGVSAAGTVTIQEPGLLAAAADGAAVTVGNSYTGNLIFRSDAASVVARPALQPAASHIEQAIITDADTGLSALFLRVVGDQMATYYMRTVYGVAKQNPYSIVTLRG